MDDMDETHADGQITSGIVERRVAAAAIEIQTQFALIIKLSDQRVETLAARIADNKAAIAEALTGAMKLVAMQDQALGLKIDEQKNLLFAMLKAKDDALVIQAAEYERRLEQLNHEHARLDSVQATYVRGDIYAKDMERLYQERRDQLSLAETARAAQDVASMVSRRNTLLAMSAGMISIVGIGVSILLHFPV